MTTKTIMNISNLSIIELRALLEKIEEEIKIQEHDERIQARQKILAIAQQAGISLEDLLTASSRPSNRPAKAKVAVRYRHPVNTSLQWTGRGRQPKWIQEWEASGQSLDALKV
ncbi:H-NS histone family protein [Collimonas fungivorans]|uniref:H-NS histone family protein n=1 Tax=Collimonas fungivorans TaxID=158899 RepID=UPI0026EE81AA|nr:H-NS histone family protein [Collimonas fungivorans]